ncbi:MAG: shikimate dehydrogenase, partial [Candidatus Omnitrophica bacterium 4484_49]
MKIDSATSLYAVIGHPVRHSLSPVMHNFLFQKYKINAVYLAFDISPNDLRVFFQAMRVIPVAG